MKEYNVICPYCNNKAELVSGEKIYPHRKDLYWLNFYLCEPCDAYVGTHKKGFNQNGTKPLGTLANEELRSIRSVAHKHFDPLWKSGKVNRTHAYQLLSEHMGTKYNKTHIGMFDYEQCEKVLKFNMETTHSEQKRGNGK